LRPIGYRDELRRFRPGLDYTVAHHGAMTVTARLDATLCFVDDDRITLEDDEDVKDIDNEKENKKGLFVCYSFSTSPSFIYCNV
jgi:Oxoglutarate and iron-dependent oxygenase degradation C-term